MKATALSLDNGRLAALSWGAREAPLWLALHGWLDNAATFGRLAPLLVEALGIRLVALDLPGHGHSAPRGADGDYPLWGYLSDVLDALDELAPASPAVTLLGHSMGAGIASLTTATYPERVQALVLIDGLASTTKEPTEIVTQLRAALEARRRPRRGSDGYASLDDAVEARVRGGVTRMDADTARPIVERALARDGEGRFHWRTDRRLTQPSLLRWSPDQMLAALARIEASTLLIQATAGVLNDRPHVASACRQWQTLERRVISGGHHLHLERTRVAQVAADIVRWSQLRIEESAG